MAERKDHHNREFSITTTTTDLMGRQSVRATFRLSMECIDAISIVATHLGIKQKSLFDHLADNMESLKAIAGEIGSAQPARENRVQKTFVISRKTLRSLDNVARNSRTPRDSLVEYSVQRLLPIIEREQKRHEKRKKIRHRLIRHIEEGEKILASISDDLGEDDPIFGKIDAVLSVYKSAFAQIDAFVEKGKIIETFDPEALRKSMQSE